MTINISPATDIGLPELDPFEALLARHRHETVSIPLSMNGSLLDQPSGVGAKYVVNRYPPAPLSGTANIAFSLPDPIPNPRLWSMIATGIPSESMWAGEAFEPFEYCDPYAVDEDGTGVWGRLTLLRATMKYVQVSGGTSAEQKAGIALGLNSTAGPGTPNITGGPGDAVLALYLRADTMKWELLCAPGANVARTVTVLSNVPDPVSDTRYRIKLLFNPVDGYVAASINGKVGAVMSNRTKYPAANNEIQLFGGTMFMQTGTANPSVQTHYIDNLTRSTCFTR